MRRSGEPTRLFGERRSRRYGTCVRLSYSGSRLWNAGHLKHGEVSTHTCSIHDVIPLIHDLSGPCATRSLAAAPINLIDPCPNRAFDTLLDGCSPEALAEHRQQALAPLSCRPQNHAKAIHFYAFAIELLR